MKMKERGLVEPDVFAHLPFFAGNNKDGILEIANSPKYPGSISSLNSRS